MFYAHRVRNPLWGPALKKAIKSLLKLPPPLRRTGGQDLIKDINGPDDLPQELTAKICALCAGNAYFHPAIC